jgi:hypothetical protein
LSRELIESVEQAFGTGDVEEDRVWRFQRNGRAEPLHEPSAETFQPTQIGGRVMRCVRKTGTKRAGLRQRHAGADAMLARDIARDRDELAGGNFVDKNQGRG